MAFTAASHRLQGSLLLPIVEGARVFIRRHRLCVLIGSAVAADAPNARHGLFQINPVSRLRQDRGVTPETLLSRLRIVVISNVADVLPDIGRATDGECQAVLRIPSDVMVECD